MYACVMFSVTCATMVAITSLFIIMSSAFKEPPSHVHVPPSTTIQPPDMTDATIKESDNQKQKNITGGTDLQNQTTNLVSEFLSNLETIETYTEKVIKFMGTMPGGDHLPRIDDRLPRQWPGMCSVTAGLACLDPSTKQTVVELLLGPNTVCVTCQVDKGDIWSLYDLRQFLQDSKVSKNYAITVRCSKGGNITLPYPMKANGLKYLHVQDCLMQGTYAEYFDAAVDLIPDTLVYYGIIDCIIHIDMAVFMGVAPNMQHVIRSAKCGPEKEFTIGINRNISYSFSTIDIPVLKENIPPSVVDTARDYHRGASLSSYMCNYTKLIEFDKSVSRNLGSQHDSVLLQNAVFPALRLFNLSDVQLRELPGKLDDWRLYFPKLQYLDFSHNTISDFKSVRDYGNKNENPSIGTINLQFNNITTITRKQLHRLQHHKFVKVDIRRNPFMCDCEMRDFVEFFQHKNNLTGNGSIGQYDYLRYLECQKPEHLKGRIIVSLTAKELGCDLETTTLLAAPIVVLCIIVVLLIIIIVISIKYRKEIVILAFTRLHILLPCQTLEDQDGKKYDAFVSYSQYDSDWVLNYLMPGLERPNGHDGFKLCLHQRDFAVGAAIAENIVKSVESSRHTILVISRKFLESEWCLMEFRTAFHQSLLEKKKHLIIVTLENLPQQELDADLKRCMQTLTYVHKNDRLFWDKIIFSLSHKRNKNKHLFKNIKQTYGGLENVQQKLQPNNINNNEK